MQRLHLDTLQVNAITKWACYPTDLVAPHPELHGRDLVREGLDFCRRHGYRSILYSLFAHAMPLSAQLSKKGAGLFQPLLPPGPQPLGHRETVPAAHQSYFTRFHFGDERYVAACVFASRDWLRRMAHELADRYPEADACWLDGGTGYTGWINDPLRNVCACPVCQDEHRAAFGQPLPAITDRDDPRLLGLVRWTMLRLAAALAEVTDLFTHHRRVPVIGNIAHGAGLACLHPPILPHLNGGLFEHAADQLDLVRKTTEARALVGCSMHYPDCYDPWPRRGTSGWEVKNKGLTILGLTGTPYLAQPGKYYYDDTRDEPARRLFGFMEQHRDLLHEQIAAFHLQVLTLPVVLPDRLRARHERGVRGWLAAALEQHRPVGTRPTFTGPPAAPVAVLPGSPTFESAEWDTLLRWVAAGGSLFLPWDETELPVRAIEPRLDLAYAELPPPVLRRRLRFEHDAPGGQTYDLYLRWADPLPAGFPTSPAIHPARLGLWQPGASWQVLATVAAPDHPAPWPLLAWRTFGRGRLLWSATDWGALYLDSRDSALGAWSAAVVDWLSGQPPRASPPSTARLPMKSRAPPPAAARGTTT